MKIEVNIPLLRQFFTLIELQRRGDQNSLIWLDKSMDSHFTRKELEDIVVSVNKLEIKYRISMSLAGGQSDESEDTFGFLSIDDNELYHQFLTDFEIEINTVVFSSKGESYEFENGLLADVSRGIILYKGVEHDFNFSSNYGLFLHKLLKSAPNPVGNAEIVEFMNRGSSTESESADIQVKKAKSNFKKVLERIKMPIEEARKFIVHPRSQGCRFGFRVTRIS